MSGEAHGAFEFKKEDAKGGSEFHRKRANRRRFTYCMLPPRLRARIRPLIGQADEIGRLAAIRRRKPKVKKYKILQKLELE
jgi:hypothetical protein